MNISNRQTLEDLLYRRLRIYSDYRIVNDKYTFGKGALPYIHHTPYRQRLEELLKNSDGGAILVTGFRGVGKSTMVHNAVSEVNQKGTYEMIPIWIALSVRKEYDQILIEIVRKLYETLSKSELWNKMDRKERERISLAYNRTLLSIKRSHNMCMEGEISGNIPLRWTPKVSAKGSGQLAEERSYLSFSEQDIEYELVQCIEILNELNRKNKVVVVIDEIDKLTATEDGIKFFDTLLERMKNLISSANALFVFVAGIDIYTRWEKDSQKINSLYDSLFCYHIYLPCIWDSVDKLFEVIEDKQYVYKPIAPEFRKLVKTGYTTILEYPFQLIGNYILFKGRGLPRKILGTFNDFVAWDGGQPCFLLTANRIQGILLVNKLLEKFRKYMSMAKIVTIYERDIYYTLFFSMLEFLIFQDKKVFTEAQIKSQLLDEYDLMDEHFSKALNKLLVEFENLAFIKKVETGYEVSDDTILKRDQSLRILDQDLILHPSSVRQMPEMEDTSVDKRFHDQIELMKNMKLTAFWNAFKAEQVIMNSKYMMVFHVTHRISKIHRYAVIYKRKIDSEKDISSNLKLVSSYHFTGPYFLDTEDHILDGEPVSSLRAAAYGFALEHLVEAKLEMRIIYQIIVQILSLIEYLHANGFGNIRLKSDNIMVCRDGAVKILDLKHICRLGKDSISYPTRIYSAPEVYQHKCGIAADYYSVGILLVEMLAGKLLSRYYTERHIDTKNVMMKEHYSQELKNMLVKATAYDPDDRYTKKIDFLRALDRCPEFRGMRNVPMPKSKEGNVISHDIHVSALVTPFVNNADNVDETTDSRLSRETHKASVERNFQQAFSEHTMVLGDAYFDNDVKLNASGISENEKEAYLVRQSNNERIILSKPVFRIGRKQSEVDYYLDNNSISRIHIEFSRIADAFYVKDFGSSNGTYLNLKRLEPNKEYKILDGDRIRLGTEEFIFYA